MSGSLCNNHLFIVQEKWTGLQLYVVAVTLLTVGLWCANTTLSHITGEMGVVAIVPLVMFFGFGILNKVLDCESCEAYILATV